MNYKIPKEVRGNGGVSVRNFEGKCGRGLN